MPSFLDKVGLQAFWTRIKNRYDSRVLALETSIPGISSEVAANKNAITQLQTTDANHESDIAALEVLVERLTPYTISTLLSTNWPDGEQTINDAKIPAPDASSGSLAPDILASKAEKEAFYKAGIYLVSQAAGTVTYGCFGDIPTISIPVVIEVRRHG